MEGNMIRHQKNHPPPIKKGEHFGCWVVRKQVEPFEVLSHMERYEAECIKCGRVRIRTRRLLYDDKKRDRSGCSDCFTPVNRRVEGMHCPKCCDMPWRRPVDKPCRCGGMFGSEPLPTIEPMHSSAAIAADNCAVVWAV